MKERRQFDVVIIGGGSAGCAVANHLCLNSDLSVALIEAGPDYGPLAGGKWPYDLLDPRFDPSSHDWGIWVIRERGSVFRDPRAQVIGGCSSHNDCAAIWGVPEDYDNWFDDEDAGWSYKDLWPYIQLIEGTCPDSTTPFRGQDGPLFTRRYPEEDLSIYQRYFVESCLAEGFCRTEDMSSAVPNEAVGSYHGNVKNSVRWNAAFAFLDPIRDNSKLTILDRCLTDKLIINGHKVEGVVARKNGEDITLVSPLVILAAGSYGSPSILMRSGIGPPNHLGEMEIPVKVGLDGVGSNLHDHPAFYVNYKPEETAWDEILEDLGASKSYRGQVILKAKSGYSDGPFDLHILPSQVHRTLGTSTLQSFICNMAPRSRGRISLISRDPTTSPRVETNYLSDSGEIDASVLSYGLSLMRKIASRQPLASVLAQEVGPWYDLHSNQEIKNHLKNTVVNYSHAVGTCKMGSHSDSGSVVNADGKLYGVDNLYVADASIIPTIPLANTNLTSMLIGVKIAAGLVDNQS